LFCVFLFSFFIFSSWLPPFANVDTVRLVAVFVLDSCCLAQQASVQTRFGLLSLLTIGAANLGVASTLRAFPKEKLIVKAERTKKVYGVRVCSPDGSGGFLSRL
jgi:hypothetical protein